MKLLLLALALFSPLAHADLSTGVSKKYTRAIYDVALNGGASVPHGLNASLPAGSFVTDVYVYINEAFTDSGTGSLALECYGTRDIMEYRDITASSINNVFRGKAAETDYGSSMIPLTNSDAAASIASVPSACEVKAVVRDDSGYVPLTDGKMTVILEYFQP